MSQTAPSTPQRRSLSQRDAPTISIRQRRRSSVFRINRTRLFNKSGSTNTKFTNIKHRGHRFMADIFTTAVDIKWRWLLLVFILAFIITWSLFGFFWWLLCFFHGDFEPENIDNEQWQPCIMHTYSYIGAFLYSLETQTTIGYGYRTISENCSEGVILLIMQSILAAFFESVLIGMVLAKASRAKKRAETIVFSKYACIAPRDGRLSFMVRVGDIRQNSFLLEAHVRLYMVKQRITSEDEFIPLSFNDMNHGFDTGEDRVVITAPIILQHFIDKSSPLYHISKSSLLRSDFEVVLVLEGSVEQTGMTTQMRTSYVPDEIMWGHYFRNMVSKEKGQYVCNFALFDSLYEKEVPPFSACDLENINEGFLPKERVLNTSFDCDDEDGDKDKVKNNSSPPIQFVNSETTRWHQANGLLEK